MKTDVFIKLFSNQYPEAEMKNDIARGFRMFHDFVAQFSRFEEQSELSRFNAGEGGAVSAELFFLLRECARFYALTEGIFDPSVLPILEKIGYRGSGSSGAPVMTRTGLFTQLIFDETHQSIRKPKDLLIDLGGIGKGYIVDKVADELSKKYAHGIVDAGGDMRIFGGDKGQSLDYFVIDTENPFDKAEMLTTLLLSDCAVATSGINRRQWRHGGRTYHHIIDPLRKTSAATGIVQVTAIAPRAIEADVLAKTFLILGLPRGLQFAEANHIPALFVDTERRVTRNPLFQKYEWKA
ncbi:MAG: FAD:protein FMN transferase [Candidatus Moraniibacteriota bacterium]